MGISGTRPFVQVVACCATRDSFYEHKHKALTAKKKRRMYMVTLVVSRNGFITLQVIQAATPSQILVTWAALGAAVAAWVAGKAAGSAFAATIYGGTTAQTATHQRHRWVWRASIQCALPCARSGTRANWARIGLTVG